MSRPLYQLPSLGSICLSCRLNISQQWARLPTLTTSKRLLTTAPHNLADPRSPTSTPSSAPGSSPLSSPLSALNTVKSFQPKNAPYTDPSSTIYNYNYQNHRSASLTYRPPPNPHRLHVYSTKHNCHITLSRGNRDALISVSAGTLGFRKAARGSYDAAYQLGAFVMSKIVAQGMLSDEYPGKGGPIKALEIVLRDFGPGRDAVSKILLGGEGKHLRGKIVRVMDSTRLKFGGTRSKKRRRI